MLIKEIKFGVVTAPLTEIPTDRAVMYVVESPNTKAEIESIYTSATDIWAFARDAGIDGGGFPYAYPWRNTSGRPVEQLNDFSNVMTIVPYSVEFNITRASSSEVLKYSDADGNGFYCSGSLVMFVKDGVNIGQTQISMQCMGVSSATGGGTSARAAFLFITADDYIGVASLYLNKNNSAVKFLTLTESQNIIEVLESFPDLLLDPYAPGGTSGPGGGTGTFSDTGDTIGIPALPTLSAVDTGFISLFNPSASDIKALANYMWSQNFDLSLFKNIVANPMECILGLSIIPVDPPNAGTKTMVVGNIPTDVSMPYLSSQYVEVDCGTLNVVEFWGSYLDYSPYTKIQLYLPYIGIVPIDIDDIQNSTIRVVYHVDVLSGACVAYVLCGGTQLYTYIGQCSSNIPITSNDFTNTLNGILGITSGIASLAMTDGASAPQAIGTIASSIVNVFKPNIRKSGNISGTGGMLGVQTPYLICQRPRQSVPVKQNHFTGYPSNITYTLADLSGYTEVQSIHLENVPCTDAEMNEILEYLTGGVVI